MDFHFGQDCLELRLSALATEMRWRGACIVLDIRKKEKRKKSMCVLFNVKPKSVQKDCITCVVTASVSSQKSGEKPENGAVEWTKASASLCRNKALVETLDLLQFHLFDFSC